MDGLPTFCDGRLKLHAEVIHALEAASLPVHPMLCQAERAGCDDDLSRSEKHGKVSFLSGKTKRAV